ncbi:MAG: DNA-directed RNA polymerase subunit alpha [bacterium]|nr:DNA-directed RNA polymerase subunit alpha [bacterium]
MVKPVPWVKFEQLKDEGGRFTVAPLKRGMGVTLGNSLRRVMLSSLSGYAITSIKIEGIKHELSTVPNVVEDVLDIICNIKGIVFKSESDEPLSLNIDKNKKGMVAAKDIKCGPEVEIVNPDRHIAEISDGGKLRIEMLLEKGIGYSNAENNVKTDQDIDVINIDASFSPIVRVNHRVNNTRVGKELDYENLVIDVWTNGSLLPEEAIKEASEILVSKFELFQALNEKPESKDIEEEDVADERRVSALNLSIDDLELSARSSNCLKRAGIDSVSELVEKDLSELIQIKNFGKKSADEINDKLKQYSLSLKEK